MAERTSIPPNLPVLLSRGAEYHTYDLVSSASFCMISRIMRHASEHPSGVAWMVMGFSAAPAFSFRWMSTLGRNNQQRRAPEMRLVAHKDFQEFRS